MSQPLTKGENTHVVTVEGFRHRPHGRDRRHVLVHPVHEFQVRQQVIWRVVSIAVILIGVVFIMAFDSTVNGAIVAGIFSILNTALILHANRAGRKQRQDIRNDIGDVRTDVGGVREAAKEGQQELHKLAEERYRNGD